MLFLIEFMLASWLLIACTVLRVFRPFCPVPELLVSGDLDCIAADSGFRAWNEPRVLPVTRPPGNGVSVPVPKQASRIERPLHLFANRLDRTEPPQ